MIEFPAASSKPIREKHVKIDPSRGHGHRLREMILAILGELSRTGTHLAI
jgi:hypothetical protein